MKTGTRVRRLKKTGGAAPLIQADRALRIYHDDGPRAVSSPAAPSGELAHTFGWDTVFAIRIQDVNAELGKPGVCPSEFAAELAGTCSASGKFGPWRVTVGDDGGEGELLRMSVPIKRGVLKFQGRDLELSGSVAVIEVELQYLPQDPEVLGGYNQRLVVRQSAPGPGEKAVSVINVLAPAGPDRDLTRALAIATLNKWFDAHLIEVSHVFSMVGLNRRLEHDFLQWLAPTFTSYAYSNGADEEESMLGVLCMVGGASAQGLTAQMTRAAIPAGARSGFLISPRPFLEHVVWPGLPGLFEGAKVSDFKLCPDGPRLEAVNSLACPPVSHGGIKYHPYVQKLSVSVRDTELVMETLTSVHISPGIDTFITQTSYLSIQAQALTNGLQTLSFFESRPPDRRSWTETAIGIKILEDVLIVIAIVIEAILVALTGGAALLLASVIVSLLIGLAAATPELIATILGHELGKDTPSVETLVLSATGPIKWPGAGDFALTWAGLSDSLQMGGDPVFAH